MVYKLLLVACGGATGSVVRYLVSVALSSWASATLPLGTFAVNVVGCLVGGALLARFATAPTDHPARLFTMVGLLGGLTTFSAFGVETVSLYQRGQPGLALANAVANLVVGLGAVVLGHWLASS